MGRTSRGKCRVDAGGSIPRLLHERADELGPLPLGEIAHERVGGAVVGAPAHTPVGEAGAGLIAEGEQLAVDPRIVPCQVFGVGGEALSQPDGLGVGMQRRVQHDVPVVQDQVRELVRSQGTGVLRLCLERLRVEVEHGPVVRVVDTVGIDVTGVERPVDGVVVEVVDEDRHLGIPLDPAAEP